MAQHSTQDVTALLAAWTEGDEAALAQLIPIVHAELRRLARHYLRRERSDHTLQTSALVNEAYLRLIKWKDVRWNSRAHFFGVSAELMRHILVDFARRRPRTKDGPVQRVALDEGLPVSNERATDLVALDEALKELARIDPRKSRIVELRFFGGLSVEETAEVLHVSPVTVTREWARAKAWLYRQLSAEGADAG